MTMYFIPASCASRTQSSALNLTGLNSDASFSYSRTGIFERFMIHSPRPSDRFPCHSPAGMAYRPQWMNRPYFASRNHSRRFSLAGSGGRGAGAWALSASVTSDRRPAMTWTACNLATVMFIVFTVKFFRLKVLPPEGGSYIVVRYRIGSVPRVTSAALVILCFTVKVN